MGLDMYLTRKTYVKNWDHRLEKGEPAWRVTVEKGEAPYPFIDSSKIKYVEEEVGYWRKANAIHNWFVENVQEGEDNCDEYWVDIDKLRELLETVNKVLDSIEMQKGVLLNGTTYSREYPEGKPNFISGEVIVDESVAEKLLPTQSGFFFGNTDYNEWYVEDLQETKRILEYVIETTSEDSEIYYQSSW